MNSRDESGGDDAAIVALLLDPARTPTDKRLDFQRLHACYSSDLLAFLRSKVGPEAMMDVEQSVWLKIWQKIATHFDGKNFRAWLFQIARHEVIDHYRRNQKTSAVRLPESLPDRPVLLPGEDEELRQALEDCLRLLDQRSRGVIRARLEGTLSTEEIARQFELTTARLFSLVSETKGKLTKCVKEKTS